MRTNANVTVYNKYVEDRAEKFQRVQVLGVAWESSKAANVIATGGDMAADAARIFIPFSSGDGYVTPKNWQWEDKPSPHWTLQVGDVIVKGLVEDEIEGAFTISALERKYDDVLVISSVDTMDMGSLTMRHWQLGAK